MLGAVVKLSGTGVRFLGHLTKICLHDAVNVDETPTNRIYSKFSEEIRPNVTRFRFG